MSSRALRRLHGNSDIVVPGLPDPAAEPEDGESDEQETTADVEDASEKPDGATTSQTETQNKPGKTKKKKKKKAGTELSAIINPFDLLNEENIDEYAEEEPGEIEDGETISQPQNSMSSSADVRSKKRKKKKKKKAGNKENKAEGERPAGAVGEEEIDEVEACVREVNELLGELPANQSEDSFASDVHTTMDMRALLTVEHRNLNPDTEMRRIFGSQVVQGNQNRQRGRGRGRPVLRSTWLARPKDSWPHMGRTGLSMELLETQQGCQYFAFQHNRSYQQAQFQFLDAVESLNPQNIVSMLNLHSYHIDALLQLSEICRMTEDAQMATELIERALYSCECAFHPMFSLTQGTCRLDYRRAENRAFYLALFRHLVFVGDRGCYRTSLEFCKLLLSLDPDGDPLCILLMIDFYALRSEQFAFLIRMYHEWESHRNLSQLPNFAFSVPLAMFYQYRQSEADSCRADAMLQNSLLMFPGLLLPLLDKCSIVPDSRVSSHAFFDTQAQISQPEALRQLVSLYIGRCFSCWKEPDAVAWLERNVTEVLRRVDEGEPLAAEYKEKRLGRYRGTPRNIYRHILVSEIKEATASLPPEMANTPVMSYDPLPPTDPIVSYTRPERTRAGQQDANPLSMFFRSLLPNFNPQEIVDEVEAGAVGGRQGNEFQQGIGALMDAMRDLLNNIRPVEPPREGQEDQDGGDGDGEHAADDEWD